MQLVGVILHRTVGEAERYKMQWKLHLCRYKTVTYAQDYTQLLTGRSDTIRSGTR